MQKLNTNQTK